MRGILPESVRTRSDKAEMSELIRNQIDALNLDVFWKKRYIVELHIIHNDALETLLKLYQHSDGKLGTTKLWQWINLKYWYRINFKNEEEAFRNVPQSSFEPHPAVQDSMERIL